MTTRTKKPQKDARAEHARQVFEARRLADLNASARPPMPDTAKLSEAVTDAYWHTEAERALFRLTADTSSEDLTGEDAAAFRSAGLVLAEKLGALHQLTE